MANILEKVIQGTLDIEVLKKYLKDEKKECCLDDLSIDIPTFDAGKFVPYFLNYIREESTCHFTSELPVISPKKIKKKRRYPRNVKSSSDTSSNTVRARESLFKSPPSNKDTLPVSVNSQYLGSSSCESENKKDHLFTSTPVKFNLDEDFPTIHDVSTSVTPTRRITPTPVRTRRNSSTIFNNSSTTCETSDESSHSFREERQTKAQHHNVSRHTWNSRKHSVKFKLEDFMHQGSRTPNLSSCQVKAPFGPQHNKNKISQLSVDVKNCSDSLSESENNRNSLNSSFQESPKEELFPPKLDSVTDSDALDKLAVIHSFCILENLVPNIVIEMSFILQLLTVEVNSDVEKEATTKGLLSGHHNCVYYATVALQKLFGIIKLLDKGTLRLLLDNKAIMEFSRSFHDDLASLYPTISINEVPYSLLKSPLNCVPFQVNFDNRNNFSSEQTFHYFKRQRDMFYEIIRTWESQNGKSGWSLPEHLGDKIRQVVDEKCGLTNIVHFVRLFQSQLIQMCCYESTLPTFNEGESPEFVGELFKSNPKKFFRLKKRLVTPQSRTSDPCPPPGFTETEEFFRTFIVAATSPSFNRHLMDSLSVKIIELNSSIPSEKSLDESTDDDSAVGYSRHQVQFTSCLITLRTLAKFLGYLVFSPYHQNEELPATTKETIIRTRNQMNPDLDVMHYLKKARDEGRLVLTIPWVIEYLSMIDAVSPSLHYYAQVFHFLYHIYRTELPSINMNRENLLLTIGLGWLFEMPVIPDAMFAKYTEFSDRHSSLKIATQTNSFAETGMDMVDQHLLYTCCPYLGELRVILAEAVVGKAKKRGQMKKIKPISADFMEPTIKSSPLQTQLEENFFQNQPEHLKKDVDFITLRIYHNMIQLLKDCVIPSEHEQAKQDMLNTNLFKDIRDWRDVNKDEFKEKHRVLLMKISDRMTDGVMERISNEVNKNCKSRAIMAVRSLASHDMNEIVIKTVAGLVNKSAMSKLIQWIHHNLSGIVDKTIRKDVDKMIAKEQNLDLNSYRLHANDPEHPFNWFYQHLLHKNSDTKHSEDERAKITAKE